MEVARTRLAHYDERIYLQDRPGPCVQGSGFRVQGSGCKVQGSWLRAARPCSRPPPRSTRRRGGAAPRTCEPLLVRYVPRAASTPWRPSCTPASSEHDHFTPTREIKRHVRALARNHPEGWKLQGHGVCREPRPRHGGRAALLQTPPPHNTFLHEPTSTTLGGGGIYKTIMAIYNTLKDASRVHAMAAELHSCKNVWCVRETEILVEQQPPQGVFVCDHAGR